MHFIQRTHLHAGVVMCLVGDGCTTSESWCCPSSLIYTNWTTPIIPLPAANAIFDPPTVLQWNIADVHQNTVQLQVAFIKENIYTLQQPNLNDQLEDRAAKYLTFHLWQC